MTDPTCFRTTLQPYLQQGAGSGSPVRQSRRSAEIFENLRLRINPEAHGVVDRIEELCEQRRQLDVQERLHLWLHNWLLIHLPLSAALILLMFVHGFMALKYW